MSEGSVTQKKRIAWIDIAKGFTILTVIWGHSLSLNCLPQNLIFSFHMPLFFILSGFTLKPAKNFKDLITRTKNDIIRLLLPVFSILAIGCVLNILLHNSSISEEAHSYIYMLFWANGLPLADGLPAMGMPWFLVALFFAKLILRVFSLIFKNGYELIGILCGFIGLALNVKHIWLPFNFDTALVCTMFVAGGILVRKYSAVFVKYQIPVFILSALIVYQALLRGLHIEIAAHSYTPFTIIEGFAASFIVCIACRAISSINIIHKIFCLVGVNTMPIFLVHHLDYFYSFLFSNENMYIECILRTFYVLLYAWAFAYVFHAIKNFTTRKLARRKSLAN